MIQRNDTDNDNLDDDDPWLWSELFRVHGTDVMVALGLLGNLMSFLVLLSSKMRSRASRLYLIVLAVTDSLVLLNELCFEHEYTDYSLGSCITIIYSRYVLKSFSAYIVVLISIQRFVTLKYPLRVDYNRPLYVFLSLSSALIFSVVSSLYGAFTPTLIEDQYCDIKEGMAQIYVWSDFVLNVLFTEVGASIVVLVLTLLTISRLREAAARLGTPKSTKRSKTEDNTVINRKRIKPQSNLTEIPSNVSLSTERPTLVSAVHCNSRPWIETVPVKLQEEGKQNVSDDRLTDPTCTKTKTSVFANPETVAQERTTETKLTQMLLVLAIVFLVVRLPLTISWTVYFLSCGINENWEDYKSIPLYHTVQVLTVLSISNFAVNFLIYVTFWPAFHRRFVRLICCLSCGNKAGKG